MTSRDGRARVLETPRDGGLDELRECARDDEALDAPGENDAPLSVDPRGDLAASGTRAILEPAESHATALLMNGEHRAAIELCARLFGPAIGRFCYFLLGAQSEAEEAAQEAFLTAFHAAPSYRGEGSLRGWLFTIARRTCAHRIASRVRRARRSVLLVEDDATGGEEVADAIDTEIRNVRLRTAVEALAPIDREILAMRFDAELSHKEISEALAIDEATARKRLARALGRLRARIEPGDHVEAQVGVMRGKGGGR